MKYIALLLVLIMGACSSPENKNFDSEDASDHFDPLGKTPSTTTIAKWDELKNKMPFEDVRDFAEQKKGFIDAPDYEEIEADAGHISWSM